MRATVAITGASGFLGRALVGRLKDHRGVAVRPYSRRGGPGLILVDDYASIESADVVVHCAQTSDAGRVNAAGADLQSDALALTGALAKKCERLLFASSVVVYGDRIARARRVDEHVTAVNAYAQMKLASEEIVTAAGGTSIRLANLCGPGQPGGTVLDDILQQIGGSGPLKVLNALAVRDFLWVSDAAEAIVRMVATPNLPSILNVGSGEGVSIGVLAYRILQATGQGERDVVSTAPPRDSTLWADISETTRCLDWAPVQSIAQGVASLLTKE